MNLASAFFHDVGGGGIKSSASSLFALVSKIPSAATIDKRAATAVLNLATAIVAAVVAGAIEARPLTLAPSSTEDVVLAAVRFWWEVVAGCFPFFVGGSLPIPVATLLDPPQVLGMIVQSVSGKILLAMT